MRRFRRSFRARRGRRHRGAPIARQTRRVSNILVPVTTIAAATNTNYTLLRTPATIDEDPDHTIVSNGTTIAEVSEGSRISFMDVTIEIAAESLATPFACSFMVWKDSVHGALAAPAGPSDVMAPSTTLQLSKLKESTGHYERWLFSVSGDKRRFRLHLPRRLRYLKQGESINIIVSNAAPATYNILFTIFGRIVTYS